MHHREHREHRDILLFQRIVPSYRVPVFRRLNEELGIVVCHSIDERSVHDQIDFPHEVMPGRRILGRVSSFRQRILPTLRKYRPAVVVTQYSFGFTTFWKLMLLKPFFGFKLIAWSHGVRNRDMVLQQKSRHYTISPFLLRLLDAVIFYSHTRRQDVISRHPALERTTFVASNAMDTDQLIKVHSQAADQYRKDDSSGKRFEVVYMGKLVQSKRIGDLLQAHQLLKDRYPIRLTVIGGGPLEQLVRESAGDENLEYPGEIHAVEETAPYLERADVMVIPGAVGLALVHAFAFGLPVITYRPSSSGPFHGPELEYLHDGSNGLLVDGNPEALANAIESLILAPDLLQSMKQNALKTVEEEANIDRMIQGFREAIAYVQRDDARD